MLFLLLLAAFIITAAYYQQMGFVERARRTDNRVLAKGIADALAAYQADQGQYPWPPAPGTAERTDTDTDTSDEEGVIRILLGGRPEPGPVSPHQGINHLDGMKSAKIRDTGYRHAEARGSDRWVSGLVDDRGRLEAVDAWGAYFRIRLDTDDDREVASPDPQDAADGRPKLPMRVIVWSAGKDGRWETWEDNGKSWD